jgi:hypothetical protein
VTLKKRVPADWTMADHQPARPLSVDWRSVHANQLCSAPPAVKRTEPTKKVTASAVSPISCA